MKKNEFQIPNIEILVIDAEQIISTSGSARFALWGIDDEEDASLL